MYYQYFPQRYQTSKINKIFNYATYSPKLTLATLLACLVVTDRDEFCYDRFYFSIKPGYKLKNGKG